MRKRTLLFQNRRREEESSAPCRGRCPVENQQVTDLPLVPSEGSRRKRHELRREHRRSNRIVVDFRRRNRPTRRELTDTTNRPPRRSCPRNRRAIRPDLADYREHVRRSCLRYQLRYRSGLFLGRRLFQGVSGSARQAYAELHRRRGRRIRSALPSDRRAQIRASIYPHVRAVDPADLRRNRFRSSGLACRRSASHVHAQRKILRRSKCVAYP